VVLWGRAGSFVGARDYKSRLYGDMAWFCIGRDYKSRPYGDMAWFCIGRDYKSRPYGDVAWFCIGRDYKSRPYNGIVHVSYGFIIPCADERTRALPIWTLSGQMMCKIVISVLWIVVSLVIYYWRYVVFVCSKKT
jgi:hypothetical protein